MLTVTQRVCKLYLTNYSLDAMHLNTYSRVNSKL